MSIGQTFFNNLRDYILAEIMRGIVVLLILLHFTEQKVCIEQIYSHRNQGGIRLAGNSRRIIRLLSERDNPVFFINLHTAVGGSLLPRNLDAGYGKRTAALDMIKQHV